MKLLLFTLFYVLQICTAYEYTNIGDISYDDGYLYDQMGVECPSVPHCKDGNNEDCSLLVDCMGLESFPATVLPTTTVLYIGSSYFTTVTYDDMKNFTNLEKLGFQYNDISFIEKGAFRKQSRLKNLIIEGNNITQIAPDFFEGLSNLTNLDLGSNNIEYLNVGSFNGLGKLTKLAISYNFIHLLTDDVFQGLPELKNLGLGGNNISFISTYAFRGLSSLEVLDLSRNKITQIPTDSISQVNTLVNLILSENNIKTIDRSAFKNVKNLKFLWLDHCGIESIAKRTFNNKKIKTLVLEYNNLRNLPNLGRMANLTKLKLQGNPWSCDCDSVPMLRWLKRHELSADVDCDYPTTRSHHYLLQFSVDRLCEPKAASPLPMPPLDTDQIPTRSYEVFPRSSKWAKHFPITSIELNGDVLKPGDYGFPSNHPSFSGDTEYDTSTTSPDLSNNTSSRNSPFFTTTVKISRIYEGVDISVIMAIGVAITISLVALVMFVVWKAGGRHRRRRRREFRRTVDLALRNNGIDNSNGNETQQQQRHNKKRKRGGLNKDQANGFTIVPVQQVAALPDNDVTTDNEVTTNGDVTVGDEVASKQPNGNGRPYCDLNSNEGKVEIGSEEPITSV